MADHLEVAGHVIQHLGHVLAQLAHAAAAGGADAGTIAHWLMQHLLTRQVFGKRLALGLCTCRSRCVWIVRLGLSDILGLAGLQFLQLQFQLLDLAGDPLRGPAKLHPAELGDFKAELLDLQRLELHRGLRGLQLALARQREGTQGGRISGQFGRGERHA